MHTFEGKCVILMLRINGTAGIAFAVAGIRILRRFIWITRTQVWISKPDIRLWN